uniref:Putative isoprenylcysteine alpha-carbonyl methylesterase ICMEL2 isoform X2 n=1 Tax=Rhizophora mucronata TaxID=61149 RepID=A0A2P2MVC9_RHIMU
MEGEESLHRFSPEVRIQEPGIRDAVSLLPPIMLFHGTSDNSIPAASRSEFPH